MISFSADHPQAHGYFRYVLEQILSGESTEVVVEQIHEYLTTIGKNVNEGKVKLDDFIVFKVRTLSFSYEVPLISA